MTRRKRAAVVTPYFVDHDAVCNDVFHSARILRAAGWDARIFAAGSQSSREQASALEELDGFLEGDDLFYYHFSTGHDAALVAARKAPGRRILKYHNVTPPEFFSLWSDELAEACRAGRQQLAEIAALAWDRVLGDSEYNLRELTPYVRPGTPLAPLAPFQEVHPPETVAKVRSRQTPSILTVGRLSPSKGHPFLLRIMRYLAHDLGLPATLDIVGKSDPRMVSYTRMLALMVREYRLEAHIRFHGEVDAQQLERHYAEASVFLLGSEHEGFCVPLVEAMAHGLPIVALAASAVPETLGGAGIAWEQRDPRLFAMAIKHIIENPDSARVLGEKGRARYAANFAPGSLTDRALALLLS